MTLAAFTVVDWAVLGGYFALLAATGWLFSRREQGTTEEYFLGGHRVPTWAAAVSLMATALSAATFIGGPQQAYDGDLRYLTSFIGQILAIVIVAALFVPAFYRARVATVYELLEERFGRSARLGSSAMFLIGRVFASGARLYIAALAGAWIVFGEIRGEQVAVAIAVIAAVAVAYTLVGGISAVIWTDVIQAIVFIGAAIAAMVVLAGLIPVSWGEVVAALRNPGGGGSKLTLIEPIGSGVGDTYTLLTAAIGFTLISVGAFGTDHDLTQRVLTCRDAKRGSGAAIAGVVMSVPVALLFMAVGLLLWVFYTRPDLMGAATPLEGPGDSRGVFLAFIVDHMPAGMSGLMMAGVFAAGLSSTNSALNAMSCAFVNDFYRVARPRQDERHYVRIGRLGVITFGVLLAAFAVLSIYWQQRGNQTLIDYALKVMAFAYSGLVGVYFAALLTRRGTSGSAILALLIGFAAVLVMELQAWTWLGAPAMKIAFPWQMTLATTLSFVVCIAFDVSSPPWRNASSSAA